MTSLPSSIQERIAALDALVSTLGNDFDREAEDAVAGIADAGTRASDIDQRLARLAVDRRILSRALDKAIAVEAAALEASAEAERRRHRDAARNHITVLMDTARRADALIDELATLLPALDAPVYDIRACLRHAGVALSGGNAFQVGLSPMAVDKVRHAVSPNKLGQEKRSLAEMVQVGWNFLFDGDDNV